MATATKTSVDRDIELNNEVGIDTRLPAEPSTSQGLPPELGSLLKEILFVFVCSSGQIWFSFLAGDVLVNQESLRQILGIKTAQLPWLVGSFNIAVGLSVIVIGSLTDLVPPKLFMIGALAWLGIWQLVAVFTLRPDLTTVFFFSRAMQGLAVGVLVCGSMSILGRVYRPGLRKTLVFSIMAAGAPVGFCIGAIQGGALAFHLKWIYGMNTILCGLLCIAAAFALPPLRPAADVPGEKAVSIRAFDLPGAITAMVGCLCIIFGLTQGPATGWPPYTYALTIVGVSFLVVFFWLETRAARPLVPTRLWRTKGFAPLMLAYFLGFGAYVGPWQFYAVQFFLEIQRKPAITVALYLLPNMFAGVIATLTVSRLLHKVPGHYIYIVAMIAYGLGPVFFLPQTAGTNYWALSMPGIFLTVFGPDLSFAAASIFITSNVPRSYQGSAGSLLVTIQNLSGAVMTSLAGAVAAGVDDNATTVTLKSLRAVWWFGLAAALLGGVITAAFVRIPKEREKNYVT